MMHPDHFDFIVKMMKAFLLASIAIYSFKCGRLTYEFLFSPVAP
jgi:hypothetical protein